jgi:hypothetical protein
MSVVELVLAELVAGVVVVGGSPVLVSSLVLADSDVAGASSPGHAAHSSATAVAPQPRLHRETSPASRKAIPRMVSGPSAATKPCRT